MTKLIFVLVNLVFVFHFSLGALPIIPQFTKCALTDTECIRESSKQVVSLFFRGAPELNITRYVPLKLKLIDLCTPTLNLVLSDVTVSGLQTSKIVTLEPTGGNVMLGKLVCDLKIEGKYKMDGLFMSEHVNSEGNLKLVLSKFYMGALIGMYPFRFFEKLSKSFTDFADQLLLTGLAELVEVIQEDKKPHWRFGAHKHFVELLEVPEVEFESVFDGVPRIESPLCDLVSKDTTMVAQDLITRIMKFLYEVMIDDVNKFFAYLPVEDLALQ